MELYLIRHGKTVWNKDNRLQGSKNIELSQEGIEAAQQLGQELKDTHFDYVFSSPLDRAYNTAVLATQNRFPIIKDENLREINFGDLEGHTYEEMESADHPSRYFFTAPEKFKPAPNGETLESVCARTRQFIQNHVEPIYNTNPSARIMLVAHGALNKAIMCYLDNHGLEQFWKDGLQKNCQATIFTFDGKTWTKNN